MIQKRTGATSIEARTSTSGRCDTEDDLAGLPTFSEGRASAPIDASYAPSERTTVDGEASRLAPRAGFARIV